MQGAVEPNGLEDPAGLVRPAERDAAPRELRLADVPGEPRVAQRRDARPREPVRPGRRRDARGPEPRARWRAAQAIARRRGPALAAPGEAAKAGHAGKDHSRTTLAASKRPQAGSPSGIRGRAPAQRARKRRQHARAERARTTGPLPLRHGVRRERGAGRLAHALEAVGARAVAGEHPQRARRSRGARVPPPAAHERRSRADRSRVPPLHRRADARARADARRRSGDPRHASRPSSRAERACARPASCSRS